MDLACLKIRHPGFFRSEELETQLICLLFPCIRSWGPRFIQIHCVILANLQQQRPEESTCPAPASGTCQSQEGLKGGRNVVLQHSTKWVLHISQLDATAWEDIRTVCISHSNAIHSQAWIIPALHSHIYDLCCSLFR